MKIVFRWFGQTDDSVTLDQIKQIPGLSGVVSALGDIPAGDMWPLDKIKALKKEVEQKGLELNVIESVNIHEDIKLGLPTRDRYIEHYQETIRSLAQAGIKVICYNFMPVFDWTRSDLVKELKDGSTVLAYEKAKIEQLDPAVLIDAVGASSKGFTMPGWEPERLKLIKSLLEQYKNVTEEDLRNNLKYFLEKVIPVAEEFDVRMAIHPDDPPWSVFGLPRIVKNRKDLELITAMVDSPYNGITFCSGSLGANSDNNLPEILQYFCEQDRVPFVHLRNIKRSDNGDFHETSHRSKDGSIDLYDLLHVLHDLNFTGYLRPDHGRMIWNEEARPGYGLYDRALGIMYILGIWDSLDKKSGEMEKGIFKNIIHGQNVSKTIQG
ncbi:mannonate dehydratase [Jeotgalibacillus sp. ET6]|uniref:mannonate dehydratase n=1 Tax=Jeotgalibacillus sp. ET6 TaxID=3037260 RepID=UPI00241844E9|nr:mannonate dehydratase [Jeotgalibacillus sp. ET6]MDG5471857.1 mannonate dehydratase [Jeotgalibacillus sp. ET6]